MSRHRGFTLIELLVVIAIIALLMSILLPAIGRAMIFARTVVCATNHHGVARAAHMYAMDNDEYLPRDGMGAWATFTYAHLLPYVGGQRIDDWQYMWDEDYLYDAFADIDAYKCPGVQDDEVVLSYIINSTDFDHVRDTGQPREGGGEPVPAPWWGPGRTAYGFHRLDNVPKPSETGLSVEVNLSWLEPRRFGAYNFWRPLDLPFGPYGQPNETGANRMIGPHDMRHGGSAPTAYFDGHGRTPELTPENFGLDLISPDLTDWHGW